MTAAPVVWWVVRVSGGGVVTIRCHCWCVVVVNYIYFLFCDNDIFLNFSKHDTLKKKLHFFLFCQRFDLCIVLLSIIYQPRNVSSSKSVFLGRMKRANLDGVIW